MSEGLTYILPIKASRIEVDGDLYAYVRRLATLPGVEVIVVDGSPAAVFEYHALMFGTAPRHLRPFPDLATPMGKVGNVLSGLRIASHEWVVIADDDVRYDEDTLRTVAQALADADVVRPQNYFSPLPWHACWDSGRMLLNRMTGGDWPGTLAVRRTLLRDAGGYDGNVMFENLELVRTITAAGGREIVLLSAFVERRPSSPAHFWSQRVRQAYDEFARPARFTTQLAALPMILALMFSSEWSALVAGIVATSALAEAGRRRAGGRRVFPPAASLMAPLWVVERAICIWLALGARVFLGGIPYRGTVLRNAATPMRVLRWRLENLERDRAALRQSA